MAEAAQDEATYPVHLTASTVLQSGAQNSVNTLALKNSTGRWMELREVKWMLNTENSESPATGGAVGCKFDLGNIPVSNGFVPVWNYGRFHVLGGDGIFVGADTSTPSYYSWLLAHPLLIPDGAVLAPTMQHYGQTPVSITARIGYSCRVLPVGFKPPRVIPVPYVASYVSKAFAAGTTIDTDASTETDLVNRFDVPVNIHRFTGRFAVLQDGVPYETAGDFPAANDLKLNMTSSDGEPIVPKYTPFRQVFTHLTRAWDVSAVLRAKSYYLVNLAKTLSAVNGDGQAFIGFVGTRKIGRASL